MTRTPSPLRPAIFNDIPHLVAGFSTRQGGVSEIPFDALNLSLSAGDDPGSVLENRRRLFEPLGFSSGQLAITGQVHGAEIKVVTEGGGFPGYDGMVTDQEGLLLCISAADCAGVLLVDPAARVLGACHAGWRGAVAGIVPRTVAEMQRLGAQPDRLRAYVSPCISTQHFEVGSEVASQFDPRFVQQRSGWEKPHVDLKTFLQDQLETAGVPGQQVEVATACTFADTQTFFSHRAEHGKTGRMMAFIGFRTLTGL